jgi:hypothetical protein
VFASGSTTTFGQGLQVAVTFLAAVAAFCGVRWQLRRMKAAAAVERTIELHRNLTTGEVGAARDRFTELMWRIGQARRPGSCHQPTFDELMGKRFADLSDEQVDLTAYPEDLPGADSSPLRDLYKVLWCFERIWAAHDASLLDGTLSDRLLAKHAIWWDQLVIGVHDADTQHRQALRDLAHALEGSRGPAFRASISEFNPT